VWEIPLREAKARLSAVIDQARQGRPSIITRHGRPEAVVLSFEEWERLSRAPSFGRLLMGPDWRRKTCQRVKTDCGGLSSDICRLA